MNNQHTPGPWRYIPDDGTGTLPAVQSAYVNAGGNFYVTQCNVDADARLIAAAPDLLEACRSALESLEWHVGQDADLNDCAHDDIVGYGDIESLKSVIANAEGRT